MADSRESLPKNELMEDEITRITQQLPGTEITSTASIKQTASTQKILNAIGSESEHSKLTSSKSGTNQIANAMQASKQSKHDSTPNAENILQDAINITPDLICSVTCSAPGIDDLSCETKNDDNVEIEDQTQLHRLKSTCNETLSSKISQTLMDSKIDQKKTEIDNSFHDNAENQNKDLDKNETSSDKLSDMVPESVYTVLQQRAQNVLKMIADKKLSDSSVPFHSKEQGHTDSHVQNQILTTPKHSTELTKKSNESTQPNNLITDHGSKELADKKSSAKLPEQTESQSCKTGENKQEYSPFNVFQYKVPSKLLKERKSEVDHAILQTESQQSARSTEQCTTDYSMKTKTDITDHSIVCDKQLTEKESKASTEKDDSEKANETLQQAFSEHSTQAVFKELSQIIQSNDIPNKLTKRGEVICYFFKQKLLSNLEAAGKLDSKSSELVNVTASKFAKWMEDILKEIDTRKKKTGSDSKGLKEDADEDVFVSATSSKESVSHKENTTANNQQVEAEEKPEVVKIQEISESELKEKYGSYIEDETKHEVFNFVGPDERPVEVIHLMTIDSDAKVMIVKKKNTDSQPAMWVVEVGPDVTLDNVTGSVSKNLLKEVCEKDKVTLKQGEWNLEKIGWENWLPKVLAETKNTRRKLPILKKQCVLRESDYDIEYPSYSPSLVALGTMDGSVFDGNNIMLPSPPQTEPSAPKE